eukprot:1383082-Alexandrium_andersonii.AAC.1
MVRACSSVDSACLMVDHDFSSCTSEPGIVVAGVAVSIGRRGLMDPAAPLHVCPGLGVDWARLRDSPNAC